MTQEELLKEIEDINCAALSAYDTTTIEMNAALYAIMKVTENLRDEIQQEINNAD